MYHASFAVEPFDHRTVVAGKALCGDMRLLQFLSSAIVYMREAALASYQEIACSL